MSSPRECLAPLVLLSVALSVLISLVTASAQAQSQGQPLSGRRDIERLPGLLLKGTERRMPLQRFMSYAAPVFWLSPDEPTARGATSGDLRVPAALPFEAQPASPVIYFQVDRLNELPSGGGPGFIADPADLGRSLLELANVQVKYIAYFPTESGVGQHLHDVEPTELRLLVGASNGPIAREAGIICDEKAPSSAASSKRRWPRYASPGTASCRRCPPTARSSRA